MEAETLVPTFTFAQIVPQTEQIIPTTVKAEPSAGQAQGTFTRQPESSSYFATPSSFLGNSPSSQQFGLGLISHFPILLFSSHGIIIPILLLLFLLLWVQAILQLPHKIFSRPLPRSQKILLASMVRMQRMRMHGWPWCVIISFL